MHQLNEWEDLLFSTDPTNVHLAFTLAKNGAIKVNMRPYMDFMVYAWADMKGHLFTKGNRPPLVYSGLQAKAELFCQMRQHMENWSAHLKDRWDCGLSSAESNIDRYLTDGAKQVFAKLGAMPKVSHITGWYSFVFYKQMRELGKRWEFVDIVIPPREISEELFLTLYLSEDTFTLTSEFYSGITAFLGGRRSGRLQKRVGSKKPIETVYDFVRMIQDANIGAYKPFKFYVSRDWSTYIINILKLFADNAMWRQFPYLKIRMEQARFANAIRPDTSVVTITLDRH